MSKIKLTEGQEVILAIPQHGCWVWDKPNRKLMFMMSYNGEARIVRDLAVTSNTPKGALKAAAKYTGDFTESILAL